MAFALALARTGNECGPSKARKIDRGVPQKVEGVTGPNLIDPEKISVDGIDDADPHVIALAVYLKEVERQDVTIITEDVNTTPRKTALADAAGVFGIPCVRFRTFLITEDIWDGKEGA